METSLFIIDLISNLHVGSGEINYGLVDNLIQRDAVTSLPTINSSSLKGALREHFEQMYTKEYVTTIFGSEPKENDTNKRKQGSIRFFEADLLTIAVRTTGGNLSYVNASSKETINRFRQRLQEFGIEFPEITYTPEPQTIRIEDLNGKKSYCKTASASLFAGKNLSLVREEDFKMLCDNEHLPIISRNCLENGISSNLFYEQVLPRYSTLATIMIGEKVILEEFRQKLDKQIVQIGGNATIGYGYCKFTYFSTTLLNDKK